MWFAQDTILELLYVKSSKKNRISVFINEIVNM